MVAHAHTSSCLVAVSDRQWQPLVLKLLESSQKVTHIHHSIYAMAKDGSTEELAGPHTSGTGGGDDIRALVRDTLREILPELLVDRTAREGRSEEPHPSGETWVGKPGWYD